MDWLWLIPKWLVIAAALSPIALGIGWAIYQGSIRPRLIPREEIEAMADAVMREHPDDPKAWVDIEEHAAWHRSQGFEQGKWRRIRRAIGKSQAKETGGRSRTM